MAVHDGVTPPWHAPPWQVSPWVHGFWSSHAVPSTCGGFEQVPVAGSQAPATWHWSIGVHSGWLKHFSTWQSDEQPSPETVFPSSHCSPCSTVPLLQIGT